MLTPLADELVGTLNRFVDLAAGERAGFDPSQPRDLEGKWVGGIVDTIERFLERLAGAKTGRDALEAPTVHRDLSGGPRGPRATVGVDADALTDIGTYGQSSYRRINASLRTSGGSPDVEPEVRGIDAVMEQSRLTHDVVVYRGIRDSTALFPGTTKETDLTGLQWTDHAYVSTSVFGVDGMFTFVLRDDDNPAVEMRILAPAGTPALSSHLLDPTEVLLTRGLTFRVVADHGRRANDRGQLVRHVDVVRVVVE